MNILRFKFILLLLCCFRGLEAATEIDSLSVEPVKSKKPQFFALNVTGGFVFPTNDFVSGENKIPYYSSVSAKYGISSSGSKWEDFAYGMPYYGVGFYSAHFFRKKELGLPMSLYVFQGATVHQFTERFGVKYEWNLGMSFNWKAYDPFDNPYNVALGSSVNIHVAAQIYANWYLNKNWDINAGVSLTHFSNGAYRLPNSGLNLVAPYVELVYHFNRENVRRIPGADMIPPKIEKRLDYDLQVNISSRQIRMDTLGTGLPSRYIERRFKVFGLSYATLFVNSYKYKWGPSLDLVYDESSGARAWRETNPIDQKVYDRVELGAVGKRFSIGLSAKGEIVMPHFSIFANLGYNLLHGNTYDYRFYQIMGVKVYLKDNLFGTFGIRASRFSKAQYLYWCIGYTIPGRPFSKKRDNYFKRILPST